MSKKFNISVVTSLLLLFTACHMPDCPTNADKVDSFVGLLMGSSESIIEMKVLKDLDDTKTDGWIVVNSTMLGDSCSDDSTYAWQSTYAINLNNYQVGDTWEEFMLRSLKNNPSWTSSSSDYRGFSVFNNEVGLDEDGNYTGNIWDEKTNESVSMTFSEVQGSTKDLEKIAAFNEIYKVNKMQELLTYDFGLSEKRSAKVAKLVLNWKKVSKSRSMSNADADAFSSRLIGVNINEAKTAYKKSLAGEDSSLDSLINKAAEVNGTSPENMKNFFENLILNK